METLRYALIGCGRISPNHIEAARNTGLTIVGICDTVEERAEEKARAFGLEGVPRYRDYARMLEKERPQLVAIATESGKHAGIALACIERGCHVIIEKPIALSLRDARAVIDKAREKGVRVCACHQNRFNKSIQKIREAVEGQRFGRLLHGAAHIRWNRGKPYYDQAPWRGTWAQDGGALMNQCIHNIDLLRWMMGDAVTEVSAYTDNLRHPFIEAEDLGLAIVRFGGGAYGLIEGTTNVYPNNLEETLYLFGERGTVKAGGHSVNIIEEWRFGDGADEEEEVKATYHENPPNVYGFGHTPLYRDVADAIRTGREPYVTGEDGYRALEMVLGIYLSAAQGKPVRFPLDKDVGTLDFAGRFSR